MLDKSRDNHVPPFCQRFGAALGVPSRRRYVGLGEPGPDARQLVGRNSEAYCAAFGVENGGIRLRYSYALGLTVTTMLLTRSDQVIE